MSIGLPPPPPLLPAPLELLLLLLPQALSARTEATIRQPLAPLPRKLIVVLLWSNRVRACPGGGRLLPGPDRSKLGDTVSAPNTPTPNKNQTSGEGLLSG